jgi:hypothetical protein
MILTVYYLRGWLSVTDAFFAVLLLNWGQGVNFIWGWQVEFFLSTVLAGLVLVLILQTGSGLSGCQALAIGVLLVLLVGSGAHGLALVPALAGWLAICAVLYWRKSETLAERRKGVLILTVALTSLVLSASYLVGFERVPYHPVPTGLYGVLRTAVQFLTMGLGPAVRSAWPLSGLATIALLVATAVFLARTVHKDPSERVRALGLAAFLAAMGTLALALGLGRNGFEPRYITLAVPAMCCVYFVYDLYAPERIRPWLRFGLLAVTCLTLWPNSRSGIDYATDLRERLTSLEKDMAVGLAPYQLITRYGPYLHIHQEITHDYMPLLRRAGVGLFASLRDDPLFREVAVPLNPAALNQATWESQTVYAQGTSPSVDFELPQEQFACGIRVTYEHHNDAGTAPCITLYWKSRVQDDFMEAQSWKNSPTGDRFLWEHGTWMRLNRSERTLEVWVCAPVRSIRLVPDFRPCVFKISDLVLLVPNDE